MTDHIHTRREPGCFRCDLAADEVPRYAPPVQKAAALMVTQAVLDDDRTASAYEQELDHMLMVSQSVGRVVQRIEGPPLVLAALALNDVLPLLQHLNNALESILEESARAQAAGASMYATLDIIEDIVVEAKDLIEWLNKEEEHG